MIAFTSLYDWYLHGAIQPLQMIYFVIAGPIIGLVSWWSNEGEFRAAKIDARMRELPAHDAIHKGDV